ncbi:hypothetical protein D0Y65_018736 [Glycine soja]|uniref:Uncharacterized protein n=1 Tax=Glycine soja TaxID=3848 RepID=A0A445K0I4_GLYSO|nr:hypothetical protein D0Y65_018736 [Glycine soja]
MPLSYSKMSRRGGSKQQPNSRRPAPPSASPSPAERGHGRGRGHEESSLIPAPSPVNAPSDPPPASTIGVPSGVAPVRAASPSLGAELESLTSAVEMQPSAPSSAKAVRFSERIGFGLVGRKIKVRANHFQVQVAEQDLFHYEKVERVCKRCGFDSFRIQNAQGQPEGIWVLWNSEDSRMDVLASEEQFVHMRLALSKG